MRKRAGAIVYYREENMIVLIKRIKDNELYWVLPGGRIEDNETIKEATIRELAEELNLKNITQDMLELAFRYKHHTYFFIELEAKLSLMLVGEEKERNTVNNQYHLCWIKIEILEDLNIVPIELKAMILEYLDTYKI